MLLGEMVFNCGLELNYITLCLILSACVQSGDVMMGRWIHVFALKMMGKEMNIMVGTTLVDMYVKCGRVDIAYKIFKCMPRRNVVAWNAMLGGLVMHESCEIVLDMFPYMVIEARPDDLTFMAMLTSYSHLGLVDEGFQYLC